LPSLRTSYSPLATSHQLDRYRPNAWKVIPKQAGKEAHREDATPYSEFCALRSNEF